jgi:hypothetical protein
MTILQSIKDKIAAIESEIETAAKAEEIKVVAPVVAVEAAVTTDWKALALEAHDFLATVKALHPGDATYDFAVKYIAKVKAAL